ncbi:hypothetical protein [Pseudactinotalea sp. HY158]|uniref:hypothetical protein n=1 Tax=Pseudactinotalea sp. HY158 TaxID=2654547 RepID=UPI00129C4D00|nr:hypothetical protein [Pseudactinotalea sp. HY158]QGH68185.1 hypothetical protein GCE65_00615 [Pseudactinotalea sp. HY158]
MKTPIRRPLVAIALAGVLTLAGCSGQDAEFDRADQSSPAAGDSGRSATGGSEDPDGEPVASGDPINATWPDPDDVIAEDVFPTLKSEKQKVRIGIQSIVVSGETMELRLVFTPEENVEEVRLNEITKNMWHEVPIALIDRENLKRYTVLTEVDGGGLYQTDSDVKARLGESVGFQAFYPAPVDDIDHVDVELGENLPLFEDVPLTFED